MGAHSWTYPMKSTACRRRPEKVPAWGCFSVCPLMSVRSRSIIPACRSLCPSFLMGIIATLRESTTAASNTQGGFLHVARRHQTGLPAIWLLLWTVQGGSQERALRCIWTWQSCSWRPPHASGRWQNQFPACRCRSSMPGLSRHSADI